MCRGEWEKTDENGENRIKRSRHAESWRWNGERKMIYVGIDPGKSGAVAVIGAGSLEVYKMPGDVFGISELFRKIKAEADGRPIRAVMEKVHSMPGDSAKGAFSFGQNLGQLEGILATLGFPMLEPSPQEWMKLIPGIPAPKKSQNGEKKTAKQKAEEKKIRKNYIHDWVQKRIGKGIDKYKADAVAIAMAAPIIWGAENGN